MKTLVLSQADVAQCVGSGEALEMVEYVFAEWGKGRIVMPPKVTLDMSASGAESWSNAMPAYVVSRGAAGVKWIGGHGGNAQRGLPYIIGVILLTDPQTGETLAIMDGALITTLRTGASAAIACKYLARKDPRTIAIIGAGTQGRSCMASLHLLYRSAAVRIADASEERRSAFRKEMSEQAGNKITEAEDVEAAVRGADIVVLVTTATSPIVRKAWIAEGALVLGMGSYQQIEDAIATSADKIVVDSWDQAAHRGDLRSLVGKGKIERRHVYAELGEIVAGRKPGRATDQEHILVALVGLGAHDICIAQHVYRRALEMGLGQQVEL